MNTTTFYNPITGRTIKDNKTNRRSLQNQIKKYNHIIKSIKHYEIKPENKLIYNPITRRNIKDNKKNRQSINNQINKYKLINIKQEPDTDTETDTDENTPRTWRDRTDKEQSIIDDKRRDFRNKLNLKYRRSCRITTEKEEPTKEEPIIEEPTKEEPIKEEPIIEDPMIKYRKEQAIWEYTQAFLKKKRQEKYDKYKPIFIEEVGEMIKNIEKIKPKMRDEKQKRTVKRLRLKLNRVKNNKEIMHNHPYYRLYIDEFLGTDIFGMGL